MMLSKVVLPEPDGPRIATNSLSRRFRLTSSNAFCTKSPVLYCLEIDLICSTMLPFITHGWFVVCLHDLRYDTTVSDPFPQRLVIHCKHWE